MDPLSIVASCIAVLQAATASGHGIHKLWDLRKAPAVLQALSNEIESLRGVLTVILNTFRAINGSELYQENREAVELLLRPVQQCVLDLRALLEYRLKRSDEVDKHGRPKVNRSEWLRASGKIERLKQNFRDARSNLDTAFAGLDLQSNELIRQSVLQIQSISLQTFTRDEAAQSFRDVDTHLTNQDQLHHDLLQATQKLGVHVATSTREQIRRSKILQTEQQAAHEQLSAALVQANNPQPNPQSLQQTLDAVVRGNQSLIASVEQMALALKRVANVKHSDHLLAENGAVGSMRAFTQDEELFVCVNATIATLRCPRLCRCQCHTPQTFKTPRWLSSVIGQLMFSYTALISPNPCDYPPCQKSPRRSQFTYYFPHWAASKALIVSGMTNNLSGLGASWSIKMPVVLGSSEQVWCAARAGNIQYLQNLFSQRQCNPFVVDEEGQTLLHIAVRIGFLELFRLLVQLGGDPQLIDHYGRSALSLMLLNNPDGLSARGTYGIDEDVAADGMNWTALHRSVALPSRELRLSPELLQQEYRNIIALDLWGQTPLHWACEKGDHSAVELLLQWKADLRFADSQGRLPMHLACGTGNANCIAALLRRGASANCTDHRGDTPLYHVRDRCAQAVDLLVAHGAKVNTQNRIGSTALKIAACNNRSIVIGHLLQAGADITIADNYGRSPVGVAVTLNLPNTLRMLLEWASKQLDTPLSVEDPTGAILSKDLEREWTSSASAPLPKHMDASTTGSVYSNHRRNAADLTVVNDSGFTVLHMAALHAGIEVMQILSDADFRGVAPLRKSKYGDTADDCFHNYRDLCYTNIRPPFEEERQAWRALMASARRQNGLGIEQEDDKTPSDAKRFQGEVIPTSNYQRDDGAQYEAKTCPIRTWMQKASKTLWNSWEGVSVHVKKRTELNINM